MKLSVETMKIYLKHFTSFILLFNAAGAIYGGGNLIIHPDGSSIQLSLEWLKYTPFRDYFVPGIILFVANGLCSIIVFISLIFKHKNYLWFVIAQGVVLTLWIIIQIILIRMVYFLHIVMGSLGVILIILGIIQLKIKE